MRKLIFCFLILLGFSASYAQLSCPTATGISPTHYSNGAIDDSLYIHCDTASNDAILVATPESGVPGWDFVWQIFDETTNSWLFYSDETDVPTSTITDLDAGGYRVTITDGGGDIVGCYRGWIIESMPSDTPTEVVVDPIPPGCSAHLVGHIIPGTGGYMSPYYNPPTDPILINDSTEISVSFSGDHTYVSDLGFYLVGPAECGSPTVSLAPNPGSFGFPSICNGGDGLVDLVFSTESIANFDVCTAPTPLTGTFGTYGPGIPIDWSPIYGCDASQPGWSVQIYDCIGLDVGALTSATITITGTTICGDTATTTYDSGPIYSPINDGSCDPVSASIFTVPVAPLEVVECESGFLWTADPYFYIEDSTTSLDIVLDPGPSVPTVFTLTLVSDCDAESAGCGPAGIGEDSELFTPITTTPPVIIPEEVCEFSAPFNLTADVAGGIWSGPGIIDPVIGLFDPASAGVGTHSITYTIAGPPGCSGAASVGTVTVHPLIEPVITPIGSICIASGIILLDASEPGGVWSGTGVDPGTGAFDPATAGLGTHVISYEILGLCPAISSIEINVTGPPTPIISPVADMCESEDEIILDTDIPGGTWSGDGISDSSAGSFDPSLAGVGTHTIVYTPAISCAETASIEITVIDAAEVPVITPVAEQCINDLPFDLSTSVAGGTWSGSGIIDASNGTFDPASAGPGLHEITYTISGPCGSSGTVSIIVSPTMSGSISCPEDICESEAPILLEIGIPGGIWSGTGITNPSTGEFSPEVAGIGTHLITYSNHAGVCPFETTFEITVHGAPEIEFTVENASGCAPLTVELTNTAFTPGIEYTWSLSNGQTSTNGASWSPVLDIPDTYDVTLTAVNAYGCTNSETQENAIVVYPNPTANFTFTDPDYYGNVDFENTSTGAIIYRWDFDGLGASSEEHPSFTFPTGSGNYDVCLEVENEYGCIDEICKTVVIESSCYIFAPNAFTPDDDDFNDVFLPHVSGHSPESYELTIFNRWGEMLFESHNTSVGWDGTYGGKVAKDGVYIWKITVRELDSDKKLDVTGSVTLIK